MICCPRTGRKPWTCRCPECVADRLAVLPDLSPTPNRSVGWAKTPAVGVSHGGRLRIWRNDPQTGQLIMNEFVGDPGDGGLRPAGAFPVDAAARGPLGTLQPIIRSIEYRTIDDERTRDLAAAVPNLMALGLLPQNGAQREFMERPTDLRAVDLGDVVRGLQSSATPEIVFHQESDPHLVARARRLMLARRHLGGYPHVNPHTPLNLFYCSVDDRYLIRVPLEQLQEPHDVIVSHDELVDYRVPPDATNITRLSTRICVHQILERRRDMKIPFPELRAGLEAGAQRVFCAWGTGTSYIPAADVRELGLQKTGESPTMAAPEPPITRSGGQREED